MWRNLAKSNVQLDSTEDVSISSLLRSGNEMVDKSAAVLASLILEIERLCDEAKSCHIPAILAFGDDRSRLLLFVFTHADVTAFLFQYPTSQSPMPGWNCCHPFYQPCKSYRCLCSDVTKCWEIASISWPASIQKTDQRRCWSWKIWTWSHSGSQSGLYWQL